MSQAENPYQTPVADLQPETGESPLASRGSRLGAVMIDSLILSLITVPLLYFVGFYDGVLEGKEPGFAEQMLGLVLGVGAFLLVNGHLLKQYGQTVGKRLLKIAIVDQDGNIPPLLPMYLKRYLIWTLAVYIPFVGLLLLLVNYLFIFRGDRRCLHDLVAGTRVVSRG
ncbi:RDD family protein [Zestomonas carbonaria]|uniref:RDD domain-containing protein n=1 Tax=Zestomonas carbonaria TaxID=2762745 RepID=A0A7U7IB35_9GAMM|nr:RDD family protein [Pseudomonas carbonaria]CAD5110035.1 hypothetical protein PSEWESI4_04351 [Pseudomonas carbonaria]